MTEQQFSVEHLANESRFVILDHATDAAEENTGEASTDEAKEIGQIAYLDVSGDGGSAGGEKVERIMYHTSVSEQYSGRGLAAVLARSAVEQTIADGHKVVAVCPYVAAWFKKNADEFGQHLVATTPSHLQALQRS